MATNNFAVSCDSNVKNTGLSKLCQDIGTIVGYIICPWGFSIDTVANAKLLATMTAKIQAAKGDRVYPFPSVFLMEDNSEDAVFQEGSVSSLFVRDGKVMFDFTHESSRYKHAAMKSHSNKKVSVILIDQQKRLHGVSSDDILFEAVNLDTFVVQKLKANNGSDATTTKVTMIFADSQKWQTNPAVVIPDYNPKDLEGLTDVILAESGTPTTSEVIIQAEIFRTGDAVLGLSEVIGEDWTVKNATTLVEQTITTITEDLDGNGLYTFAFGTPLAAGTYLFNLKSAPTMTTEGYESDSAVSITLT